MKDPTKERDTIIAKKIIKYCDEIRLTHKLFKNDKDLFFDKEQGCIYRNAITMPILQIGELVKNLSEEFRMQNNNIPWKSIARTRDFYAHNYGALNFDTTWETSQDSVRELKEQLEDILLKNNYISMLNEVEQVADKISDALNNGEIDRDERSVEQER